MESPTVPSPASGDVVTPPRRLGPWIVGGLVVAALALAAAVGVVVFEARDASRPIPEFPLLADAPDGSLVGTVAYTAPDGCVTVVAAAGSPSREVLCLTPEEMTKAPGVSKVAGPQLRWLDDDRLEVTMFGWEARAEDDPGKAPEYEPVSQKRVDVRTGEVEEVAAADLPSAPADTGGPQTNQAGQRITWTSDPASGRVEVELSDDAGSRTLLDVRGPGKYAYGLREAYWAPSGDWVVADDGRILVITTGPDPQTRVLVSATSDGASGGSAGPRFAVTDAELLPET